jgi:excisionase family DNA binding protein
MDAMDRALTVREVVSVTGLSERTIRGMIAKGSLPAIRPRGVRAVRITEGAVRQLIGNNEGGAR